MSIIELLKSGNFTIAYHDNQSPSLYEGRHTYEELEDKEEIQLEIFDGGYVPDIVCYLVEALGGRSTSI